MIKSIFLTMIQRIQSFYLFLVAALVLSMLFMPLAGYSNADGNWQFLAMGVYTMADPAQMVLPAWPIAILIALMGLLACISIFLYKNRILQMKFCLFNGLMLLAFYPIFFLYLWVNGKSLAATSSLAAALVIPLVAVILEYMAYRKINQDEQLVRSADRIR
ncbi:DUF4293 family protein [Tannerella sp. AM09-19]|jgi:hypothetical protein|nr:DUF4293 family protein [Tannerella sp. AM09-19]